MTNLAIFKPPDLQKKWSEVTYLFKFDFKKLISSTDKKNFVENYYFDRLKSTEKKITPSINIPFSSNVGTKTLYSKSKL